jgi:hypothetical protein
VSKTEQIKNFLHSYKLSFILRLVLGVSILISAIPKLMDIETNSIYVIYSYYIFPVQPVDVAKYAGLIVPYLELLIGLGLICGVLTRLSAMGWAVLSLAYFLIKLDLIFIQERIIPCGCYASVLPEMLVTQSIWLDVINILFCIQIIAANKGKPILNLISRLPERWQKSKLKYMW